MNLHETVWTIGIYYGLNKVAALYKVSLEEARPFLQRDLECSQTWSIYNHIDRQYYERDQILSMMEKIEAINPDYNHYREQLDEARRKLAQAKLRLEKKKKQVLVAVQDDTLDLFGERKSARGNLLFDERVEVSQTSRALGPFQLEVSNCEAEVRRVEKILIGMESVTLPSLFENEI
jgi:hypothetical protein